MGRVHCREARLRHDVLLPLPAGAAVRFYHQDWSATLGLSYAVIVDTSTQLAAESGQPTTWMSLEDDWDSYFSDDPSRIRWHAQ
jgi:8-oxo-dGTP diphosphatase